MNTTMDFLNNKTVLVTGATGLIGKTFIKRILEYNIKEHGKIQVIAFVRNMEKAEKIFAGYDKSMITYMISDINIPVDYEGQVDYIVHGASVTSSQAFVQQPVETIMTAINGTKNVLQLAVQKKVKAFIYLSSMEVYGAPKTDDKITEAAGTDLDTMQVRTSYPESKRMCESLCSSYFKEYGVPVRVMRLTQTFGPGVEYNDGRVFAEFARCSIENKNIILHTHGETKRNYLYTEDAVDAILTVLKHGKDGEAYNVANEETYCSIYEMAQLVASISDNSIKVVIDVDSNGSDRGYAPVLHMNLDCQKLRHLGWSPKCDLQSMYKALIESMR